MTDMCHIMEPELGDIINISSDEDDLFFVLTPMKRPASPQSDDECALDESSQGFEPESMSCRKKRVSHYRLLVLWCYVWLLHRLKLIYNLCYQSFMKTSMLL